MVCKVVWKAGGCNVSGVAIMNNECSSVSKHDDKPIGDCGSQGGTTLVDEGLHGVRVLVVGLQERGGCRGIQWWWL